jgi:hypothetical protein
MSKRWVPFLTLLAICGLVACRSAATPTVEPSPTVAQVRVPTATATVAQKSEPTPAPTATPSGASEPAPAPTPPWQIPTVRETDWTKGAQDAGLVIVEYSDYQ